MTTDPLSKPVTPAEQIARFREVVERLGSEGASKAPKSLGTLAAEELTSVEQRRRSDRRLPE